MINKILGAIIYSCSMIAFIVFVAIVSSFASLEFDVITISQFFRQILFYSVIGTISIICCYAASNMKGDTNE